MRKMRGTLSQAGYARLHICRKDIWDNQNRGISRIGGRPLLDFLHALGKHIAATAQALGFGCVHFLPPKVSKAAAQSSAFFSNHCIIFVDSAACCRYISLFAAAE